MASKGKAILASTFVLVPSTACWFGLSVPRTPNVTSLQLEPRSGSVVAKRSLAFAHTQFTLYEVGSIVAFF